MSDWGEKLYAAIEPADPYLDDRVLIISGLYLLSSLILRSSQGLHNLAQH
jgi:hypothetical protein